MSRKYHVAYLVIIGLLCGMLAWQWGRGAVFSLHLSFADEQTDEFARAVDAAVKLLSDSPSNLRAAEDWIEHVESYYPSGTKQVKGSRLDRVVERTRALAKRCIVEMVRCSQENRGDRGGSSSGKDTGTEVTREGAGQPKE